MCLFHILLAISISYHKVDGAYVEKNHLLVVDGP